MKLLRNRYKKIKKKLRVSVCDCYYQLLKSVHKLGHITVEITGQCNLRCRHCYMDSESNKPKDELSYADWCKFFNQVKKDFKKVTISITGGEPLLRKDIFKILAYINKKGFRPGLSTNGLLLNKENILKLKGTVSSISVSLDGFEDSHNYLRKSGTYSHILKNVRMLVKSNFPYIAIKTVVYKRSLPDLEKFYQLIKSLGVNEWHIIPMELTGRGKTNAREGLSLQEYLKLCDFVDKIRKDEGKMKISFEEHSTAEEKTRDGWKDKRCVSGITQFAILYNGDIIKCIQGDRKNAKIEGNIRDKNFNISELWENGFGECRCEQYRFCEIHYLANKIKNKKI